MGGGELAVTCVKIKTAAVCKSHLIKTIAEIARWNSDSKLKKKRENFQFFYGNFRGIIVDSYEINEKNQNSTSTTKGKII